MDSAITTRTNQEMTSYGSTQTNNDNKYDNLYHEMANVIFSESTLLSTQRKVALISADLIWIVGCVLIAYPPAQAALDWAGDSPTPAREVFSIISAFGCFLCWGTLYSWGGIELINKILKKKKSIDNKFLKKNASAVFKAFHIAVSVLLGTGARLPSFSVAILYTNIYFGLLSFIGLGLPSYSMYRLIGAAKDGVSEKLMFDGEKKLALNKKNELISLLNSFNQNLPNLSPQTVQNLCNIARESNTTNTIQMNKISELIRAAMENNKAIQKRKASKLSCRNILNIGAQGIGLLFGGLLLYQFGLLGQTAGLTISESHLWVGFCVTISVIAMLWLSLVVTAKEASNYTDMIYGNLTCDYLPKTFVESMYPKVTSLLKMLNLMIAVLPYAELIDVAEQYYSWDTPFGKLFIIGNVVATTLLIAHAINHYLEVIIESLATSKYANEETKNYFYMKNKISSLIEILEQMETGDTSNKVYEDCYKNNIYIEEI